jgi:hypothetical protein
MLVTMLQKVIFVSVSLLAQMAYADEFIALADEDPSKDLIIDVFGSDPSNIYFFRQGFIQHSL